MLFLLIAAIIPVVVLCLYINKKDQNKEPKGMLAKLFIFGVLICIPVIIVELLLGNIFDTESEGSFLVVFINVFFGIALIEEIFKWFVVKGFGYNSKEFDEIYDIIVYSVFASLGFACFENIGYVLDNGFTVAIIRALFSVPGHTCFGVLMGYYLSKAKVNSMNGNNGLAKKNLFLSILIPTLFHTMFDTCLTAGSYYLIVFLAFDIFMVIYCFKTVNKMSKIQQSITTNVEKGNIVGDKNGNIMYNTSNIVGDNKNVNFCPICGTKVEGYNFCPSCGFKVKE